MSKKKSFSGSTMKLKDFHGGSIPSDLPLPSAPGVSASPVNRVAYDRPMSGAWGIGGRMDHHQRPSRPGSAGGSADSRGFVDDSVPFLPSSARIGRNFEEDERKPFDAAFAPRRAATIDPDTLRLRQPVAVDLKQPQQQAALGRPGSSPAAVPYHLSAEQGLPSAWNGSPTPSFSGSGGSGSIPAVPNAWGTRKDALNEPQQQTHVTFPGPFPAVASSVRLAQASAVEKISSGRWQSKPYPGQIAGADMVGSSEMDAVNARFDETNGAYGLAISDQRQIDRVNALDPGHGGNAGHQSYEAARSPVYMEVKEKNITVLFDSGMRRSKSNERNLASAVIHQPDERTARFPDELQEGRLGIPPVNQIEGRMNVLHISPQKQGSNCLLVNDRDDQLNGPSKVHLDSMSSGSQVYQQGSAEAVERPKLRLLPRTKPLDASERVNLGGEQERKTSDVESMRDNINETYGNQVQHSNPGEGDDHGQKGISQVPERPKLNLKPRSRPLEESAENDERIRNSVFGGARPRELVLKDRGVETAPTDVGHSLLANRYNKQEGLKLETKAEAAASPRRPGDMGDGYSSGRRSGTERKDFKIDHEKNDVRKGYQKNDQRQNTRENERSHDGRSEPESWRKPVEEPTHEVSRPSYGKVASAAELAQVFSKSISDAHHGSRLVSPKGAPPVPFSRLTDNREIYSSPNPRKINGF